MVEGVGVEGMWSRVWGLGFGVWDLQHASLVEDAAPGGVNLRRDGLVRDKVRDKVCS